MTKPAEVRFIEVAYRVSIDEYWHMSLTPEEKREVQKHLAATSKDRWGE